MKSPTKPYYAVIFTSTLAVDDPAYTTTAAQMEALAAQQPGYLAFESVRQGNQGISISYWADEASIANWKAVAEHQVAQQNGKDHWYQYYRVRVAKVERDYEHTSS